MTGILAAAGAGGVGSTGGGNHPNALSWNNLYDQNAATTQFLTIAGVGGGTAPITMTHSGAGIVQYILNGQPSPYTGAFNVADADTLGWTVINAGTSPVSGSVTVSSGGFTVGTFTYLLTGNRFF